MKLLGIDHIQLAIPAEGEEAGRRFYGALLGLTEVPKPDALKDRGGLWFEQGGLKVHLGVDADFSPAKKAHPGFLVDDLDALVSTLQANSLLFSEAEPVSGMKRIFTSDPFGNRLEFLQR